MSYNLGPVKPWVEAAANELGPKFGITSIGGYRLSATDPDGHPAGRALDLMCTPAQGGPLAAYTQANARRLGVEYIIWQQRIWSVGRAGEGWRPMSDRGSPTANHMDHVHVNFNATAPAGGPVVAAPSVGSKPAAEVATSTASTATGTTAAPVLGVVSVSDLADQLTRLAVLAVVLGTGAALITVGLARAARPVTGPIADGALSAGSAVSPHVAAATTATSTLKGAKS